MKYCYLCYPEPGNPCGIRLFAGSSCGFYCYPYCYLCYPDHRNSAPS
nr:MAG TPA: hypothetical protein [Caudoviricetes sp.]